MVFPIILWTKDLALRESLKIPCLTAGRLRGTIITKANYEHRRSQSRNRTTLPADHLVPEGWRNCFGLEYVALAAGLRWPSDSPASFVPSFSRFGAEIRVVCVVVTDGCPGAPVSVDVVKP